MSNRPARTPAPVARGDPSYGTSICPEEDALDTPAAPALVALHHVPPDRGCGEPPPGPGEPIPGYEIASELGRGAMGVVYKARQVKLDRLVALKMMHGWATATAEDRGRFRAEAVAVAKVQHPNVIQIFDVGDHAGMGYLAVEYVDGGTLANLIGRGRALPLASIVRLVAQIARGVGAAHSKGIVHRDLKPANILLTADGIPKVADFGLAKQLGGESRTVSGAIMGTPAYMSPEQAAGRKGRIAPQSDVFALGVVLYEAVTGEQPFKGDSMMETLGRVMHGEPLEMRFRRRDVPPELEAIVHRCLCKVPAERYPTADALADDLDRLLAPARPRPEPSTLNVYHVLTALTAAAAVALAVWLFGFPDFGRKPATAPTIPAMGPQFSVP